MSADTTPPPQLDPTRLTRRSAYPHLVHDAIRYSDTDRQGHVNNAIYATYLEFGRTQLFFTLDPPLLAPGFEPVVARLELDYRRELLWPGEVAIGTAVLAVGNSSMRLAQAVFSGEICAASAELVLVQLDSKARRPKPWSSEQREILAGLALR